MAEPATISTPHHPPPRSPAWWVPSLYFAEGIPYVVVMSISVVMYKLMGVSNTDIALYTSWLYLPWVIKPLWSPLVDLFRTKRFWIIAMQLVIGAGLAGVALTIPLPAFFQYTLAFLWLLAFSSATHDIAADGFYMLALAPHQQALFVGVRSTFYRLAMITGQGLLIMLAGYLESHSGLPPLITTVAAKPIMAANMPAHPDSLRIVPLAGDLHLVAVPADLTIGLAPRPNAEIDSILAFAKKWNTQHGFYALEQKSSTQKAGPQAPGWWQREIAQKLAGFLRRHFGPQERAPAKSNTAGNVGIVFFHLSKAPAAEKIAVNFGREAGDKSITLLEGSRFQFTAENWQRPMMAVLQLDRKLKTPSSASFKARAGDIPRAWAVTFFVIAGMFFAFFIYHRALLPHPAADAARAQSSHFGREFFATFAAFFKKKNIGVLLAFLVLYRFAEAQLVKLASPFLLDAAEAGGLALTAGQVGFVYGTVGVAALTLGGLLGGWAISKHGLKFWLWPMVLAINIPDAVYIYLAYALPDNFFTINLCVALESFGYGFGFTAYMVYMLYISEGEHRTAHFAICTGFMALGMMIPGMFSGWLQEIIGYRHFFVWVMLATSLGFLATKLIQVDPEFGKKKVATSH